MLRKNWNSSTAGYRLFNAAGGMVLGIRNMSTADGADALQWGDNGTADHNWQLVSDGTAVRLRNLDSNKVLGVDGMSTADNARVLQWADNGTADHLWTALLDPDAALAVGLTVGTAVPAPAQAKRLTPLT
ncbi:MULTISPECIES: RICIN domain-containing protein [unclassified Saccharothrix]|uniref:RICIN domain-containing protein n=1 Tax=unclassified Saccharothrix TaxID=2593673 RepID=UPI00307D3F75